MEFEYGQELGCSHEDSEGFASDLTDGEEDSMVGCSCCTSMRCLKRRFDALVVDGSAAAVPEQRSRRRIHEQFALLRAVVPDLCSDEKGSILTGACEYIEKLQKLEAELRCELDMDSCGEEDVSCCEDDDVCPSSRGVDSIAGSEEASSCCSQPTVQVVRTEQGLKMHVKCEMRPGLLLGMMELLESSGLAAEEANIECVDQCLVFDAIGISEVCHTHHLFNHNICMLIRLWGIGEINGKSLSTRKWTALIYPILALPQICHKSAKLILISSSEGWKYYGIVLHSTKNSFCMDDKYCR